ncbi:cytochrome P460 family protein [Methylobacterium sp. J-076]|uniref:cytochrome P460 family protein n=1 Tax=Methylobacterium sp. J-076 TaxID=2836655 RepID=UPI001FB8F03F|nr:cytochrome P460 family protein [Methylobacterium sp. J-076]MCJ2014449.1 cytochrome P460 family protein [Methylobacterium sp. J-076]
MVGKRICLSGVVLAMGLAALPARAEEGNVFSNLFKYGGTTVPPSQAVEVEPAYCPTVDVSEGGAALRIMAGGNVRTQIGLGRMARECIRQPDGSVLVKVGVEARVLLGPAGAPGRFDVPVTFAIKHAEKVVTSRVGRTSAEIDRGEAQTLVQIVVDDLIVPSAMASDYDIEVSLGSIKAPSAKAKRRKPAAAAAAPAGGGDAAQ